MKKNHEKLSQILEQLFVLDDEIKNKLIQEFPNFYEKKQEHLIFVLQKSLQKQNEFIQKALEKNPNLMSDIKKGVGEKMKEIRKDEEKKNESEELEILKQLENDILRA